MPTDDLMRERIAALEVEMRHLREQVSRQADELREVREALGELRDLLTQAKGAKWAIAAVIMLGGFVASYAPTAIKWALAVK